MWGSEPAGTPALERGLRSVSRRRRTPALARTQHAPRFPEGGPRTPMRPSAPRPARRTEAQPGSGTSSPESSRPATRAFAPGSAVSWTDSGHTSAMTDPGPAEPSRSGTRDPSNSTSSRVATPEIRLVRPTNSATNRFRGRSFSSVGDAICSRRPADITPIRSPSASASSWS